jgi:DNA-binding GntR family transcriptional regulator
VYQTLSEQTYEALRQQIVSGKLGAGERLYEERLAACLGVSKTPVRQALHRLHRESMVDFRPRRGFRVATFTSQDLQDVVQLREMLEAIAVRRLAEAPSKAVIASLRACFDGIDSDASETLNGTFAAADIAFHRLIISLAGSSLVSRLMSQLDIRVEIYLVRGPALDAELRRRLHHEHLAIIDAIEAGNVEFAERLIREHIRDAWEVTKEARLTESDDAVAPQSRISTETGETQDAEAHLPSAR